MRDLVPLFLFQKKGVKDVLALVGITWVKDTSVIKKDKKNNESG